MLLQATLEGAKLRRKCRREGGLLQVELVGLLTLTGLRALRDFLLVADEREPARAVLIDLRRAVVAVTDDDWRAYANGEVPPMPLGMIVNEAQLDGAFAHAMRMAFKGYERAAFPTVERALEWAGSSHGTRY